MSQSRAKQCTEGLIIVLLGCFFLYLSLTIRKNPVSVEGFLNILVQAKAIPTITSAALILLGVRLSVTLYRGGMESSAVSGAEWKRLFVLTAMTVVYCVVVIYAGFLLPTIAYLTAMLLFLNWKSRSLALLGALVVIYTAVTIFAVPMILGIQMP